MLLLALVAGSVSQVQAFDLTANSADNEVFLLLLNENPGGVFHSISVNVDAPAFISNTIEVTNTPGAINGGGSDLVVLQFDVGNAAFNTSGDLIVTVSGMVAGNAVSVDFTVPLRVWFSAPAAQGTRQHLVVPPATALQAAHARRYMFISGENRWGHPH